MKKIATVLVIIVFMGLNAAMAMAQQQQVNVSSTHSTGVEANPQLSVTSIGGNLPEYIQPTQSLQHPTTSGFPTIFPALPYGWNLTNLQSFVIRSGILTRAEIKGMLAEAGGSRNVLLNGAMPYKERGGADPNQRILIISRMPYPIAPRDIFQAHGEYVESLEKKKMATMQQCLYVAALYAMDRYSNVLEVIIPGHDGGVGSVAKSKGGGLILGGGMPGPGITGAITGFLRKDKGFSGFAGIPFIQAQTYILEDRQLNELAKVKFNDLRQALLRSPVAPEVSQAEKMLLAAHLLQEPAPCFQICGIEDLKKAAAAAGKK